MKKLLINFLFLFLSISLTATNYYVSSSSGNDNNNGTSTSTPWKTLQYAESHATTAGDIIALKKGDNWSSVTPFSIHHGGAVGNPITWDGSLWGTGANAIISANGANSCIVNIWGCKNVIFQKITVDGNNHSTYSGIIVGGFNGVSPGSVQNSEQYITIQDCTVQNVGDGLGGSAWCSGIHIMTWNNDISNVTVQRNTVSRINNHGIAWYNGRSDNGSPGQYTTKSSYCGYNNITKCGLLEDNVAAGILIAQKTTDLIVEHNTINQNGEGKANGIGIGGGLNGTYSVRSIIRYNDIRPYWGSIAIQDGGAITLDCYYNLMLGNGEKVICIQQTTGLSYAGASMNFYNNTIVNNATCYANEDLGNVVISTFKNNILIGTGTGQYENSLVAIYKVGTTAHSNNSYWRTVTGNYSYAVSPVGTYIMRDNMATWESTSKHADPLLVNLTGYDWHLQSGSPCINAGTNIPSILQYDYNGSIVANPSEIGAYEFGGITPPAATTYYISTSGSDSNNGTSTSTPWKTLQYAESHATAAGSIIALKKGDNWSSTTALSIQHGGAVGNPIVWDGSLWGTGENAIISASGKHLDPSGSTGGAAIVCVTGCKNVTFQKITLNGNNYYCYGFVVGGDPSFAPNAHQNDEKYITLQDCHILGIGGGSDYCIGVFLRTWFNDMSNITIQRNTVENISSWGIGAYLGRLDYGAPSPGSCFDLYIGYNTVTNVGTSNDELAKGIGLVKACTRAIIEHNTITQGANGHAVSGINLSGWEGVCPTGVIIRYNDVRMNDQPAFATENGYPMQADIYYNKFYTDKPVYSVVWIMPPSAASYSGGFLHFYNNDIVSNNANCFKDENGTANFCTLKNNILINTNPTSYTVIQTTTLINHSNNCIWRTGTGNLSCVVDQTGTKNRNNVLTWESTAIITDPLFVNLIGFDWHLQSNSPVINKGTDVGLSADYDGISIN